MKKIKLMFVANQNISPETLHSLYTTVRFKNEKLNVEEDFKVWSEGRAAFIIIDEDKRENLDEVYTFTTPEKKEIKIKLMRVCQYNADIEYKANDDVSLFSILSHSRKHYEDKQNQKLIKPLEYCVLDTKSRFKKGTKKAFLEYLTKETGLDFVNAEKNNTVKFERIVMDENEIFSKSISKKVAIRNVIAINAETIKVLDADKVNALSFRQIGKRKSYGMGNVLLNLSVWF